MPGDGKARITAIRNPNSSVTLKPDQKYVWTRSELNRVLGGRIVADSLVLIGGEPGIGKSTLMLQIGLALKEITYCISLVKKVNNKSACALSGLPCIHKSRQVFILAETNTQSIFLAIENQAPDLVIVDSIQTLYSPQIESTPGSVGQVRQCAAELMKFAKGN